MNNNDIFPDIFSPSNGSSSSSNDKGWFATPAALRAAYPVGENGWFAIVGSTDTVWIWDVDTNDWLDSGEQAMGDVVGPASSTDNGFVLFDGTTGKQIKEATLATMQNALKTERAGAVVVGTGKDYTTVGAAINAGESYIRVVENCNLGISATLTKDVLIEAIDGITINFAAFVLTVPSGFNLFLPNNVIFECAQTTGATPIAGDGKIYHSRLEFDLNSTADGSAVNGPGFFGEELVFDCPNQNESGIYLNEASRVDKVVCSGGGANAQANILNMSEDSRVGIFEMNATVSGTPFAIGAGAEVGSMILPVNTLSFSISLHGRLLNLQPNGATIGGAIYSNNAIIANVDFGDGAWNLVSYENADLSQVDMSWINSVLGATKTKIDKCRFSEYVIYGGNEGSFFRSEFGGNLTINNSAENCKIIGNKINNPNTKDVTISSISGDGTEAIIVTATDHTRLVGDLVTHANITPATFVGDFVVTTVDSSTQYRVKSTQTGSGSASGGTMTAVVGDYNFVDVSSSFDSIVAGNELNRMPSDSSQNSLITSNIIRRNRYLNVTSMVRSANVTTVTFDNTADAHGIIGASNVRFFGADQAGFNISDPSFVSGAFTEFTLQYTDPGADESATGRLLCEVNNDFFQDVSRKSTIAAAATGNFFYQSKFCESIVAVPNGLGNDVYIDLPYDEHGVGLDIEILNLNGLGGDTYIRTKGAALINGAASPYLMLSDQAIRIRSFGSGNWYIMAG